MPIKDPPYVLTVTLYQPTYIFSSIIPPFFLFVNRGLPTFWYFYIIFSVYETFTQPSHSAFPRFLCHQSLPLLFFSSILQLCILLISELTYHQKSENGFSAKIPPFVTLTSPLDANGC